MRKVIYLLILSSTLTSCTIEDVINYLNGKTNNLTEEQKKQVQNTSESEATTLMATSTTSIITNPGDTDQERDKGNISPPR